jgi:hypothetical protein
MALSDILKAVKPTPVDASGKAKIQRKYVQFTMEEWTKMEASAGEKLETSAVKALVEAIFTGAVSINVAKK